MQERACSPIHNVFFKTKGTDYLPPRQINKPVPVQRYKQVSFNYITTKENAREYFLCRTM